MKHEKSNVLEYVTGDHDRLEGTREGAYEGVPSGKC